MGPHDTALEREHFGRSDDQTVPHRRSKMPPAYQHCLLSMHCAEQGLCNGQASVCMSVCPVIHPLHSAAAGLPLCARRQEISFDCCTAGAQQQRRHSMALSSKCEQCYVYSWRRKLNIDNGCLRTFTENWLLYPEFLLTLFLLLLVRAPSTMQSVLEVFFLFMTL